MPRDEQIISIPIRKQDEDICDFIQIAQGSKYERGGYDLIDCNEVCYCLEDILAECIFYPRVHFIKSICSVIINHKFRRYWCEFADNEDCNILLSALTNLDDLDRWMSLPFKMAYDEILEMFNNLASFYSEFRGMV